ncbi:MAG: hypothetical protein ACU837_13110 [Gammaproteobacteria bacterium]
MKKWPCTLCFLLASSFGNAAEKPLDLELDTRGYYQVESAKVNDTSWYEDTHYRSSDQQLSDECRKMITEIDAMQANPQHKFALQQRYNAECLQ